MSEKPDDAVDVLRTVWAVDGQDATDLDAVSGTDKPCKNMRGVSFDGMAEPGTDLTAAWRERLEREGKLRPAGQSIRDLVLGPAPADPS